MSNLDISMNTDAEELVALLEQEFAALTPLSLYEESTEQIPATKDDLQQFKRFTYKNFQMIQDLLDEQAVPASLQEEIDRLKSESSDHLFQMAKTAVDVFNLFDRVQIAFAAEQPEIAEQLTAVIDHSLAELRKIGIVELPVYGEEFNGDYMESLGTVSADEAPEGMEIYHVALVFRRAFKFEGNQKIIQDALVKTIL